MAAISTPEPDVPPEVRAEADRLILDTAHLIDVLEELDEVALASVSGHSGKSILATISAIGEAQTAFAAQLTGSPLAPRASLVDSLRASRRAILCALLDPQVERPVALDALAAQTQSAARHVLDLAEACPSLLDDALRLDWILFQRFPGDAAWMARRKAVVQTARERRQAAKKRAQSDAAARRPAKPRKKKVD